MRGNGVCRSTPTVLSAAVRNPSTVAKTISGRAKVISRVDLRELRLAVGAQVLVAEAAHDLEILVEARDHEDLLEQLRRLRQRVELAGMHAAGHEVVARAFGRGARHERRLDFVEALRVEVVADGDRDVVAELNVVLHLRPAQVEVAVLEAHLFVGDVAVGGREGQRLAVVEDAQLVGDDFDFAGGDVLVDGAGVAQLDVADNSDYELGANRLGLGVHGGAGLGGDDDLGDAAAVAQVEEDQVAEVAAAVDPSHENDFGAGIGGAQRPTHMSAFEITKKIEHGGPS